MILAYRKLKNGFFKIFKLLFMDKFTGGIFYVLRLTALTQPSRLETGSDPMFWIPLAELNFFYETLKQDAHLLIVRMNYFHIKSWKYFNQNYYCV